MKIGFDGRYAEGDLFGVGRYIQSLVQALDERGVGSVIFYSRKPKSEIKGKNIKTVILPPANRYFFEQVLIPYALKKEKVDLYHAPGNIGVPVFCPVPAVLTVHDVIPLEIKSYFSYSPAPFLSELSYKLRLQSSLANAAKIITVSEYVKRKLVKKLKVVSAKIKTIYSGAPVLEKGGTLPGLLVGKKYILNQGGIDIRKNLDRLIEAFAIVNLKHPDIKLVITGENEKITKDLKKLVIRVPLIDSIIFTGYVDDKTLGAIIRNAELVCYPTLSEGFGFPILEAFAAGVPVISSNTSAIPEVAGKAAVLVDPENINGIAGAIEKVFNDKKLSKRMVLEGRNRYNRFSWEKSADEYLDLYNSIK